MTTLSRDKEDVKILCGDFESSNIENENIRRFRDCFNKFKDKKGLDLEKYAQYVYGNCTFLVSKLPKEYEIDELNLYYEKMNATGKQLEPHEILKVEHFAEYSRLWNKAADFTTFYKSERNTEGESKSATDISILGILNDNTKAGIHGDDSDESKVEIKEKNAVRAIIDFPTFLLHVLSLTVGDDKKTSLEPSRLLKTFEEAELEEAKFIEKMMLYRQWLDDNIIHINEDNAQEKYAFWAKEKEKDNNYISDVDNEAGTITEEKREVSKKMEQLQSMLYVSSNDNQKWLLEAYRKTDGKNLTFSTLQEVDNELNKLTELVNNSKIIAKYPKIERYWFWKLDFILWLNRDDVFSKDKYSILSDNLKTAVKNFSFKRNRSIEHLHAQNREKDSAYRGFDAESQDRFRNLAMISSSANSAVSNKTVAEKFAKIIDHSGGNFESLKLLLMFRRANVTDSGWTYDTASEHEKDMIEMLECYYGINKQ